MEKETQLKQAVEAMQQFVTAMEKYRNTPGIKSQMKEGITFIVSRFPLVKEGEVMKHIT